MNCALKAGGSRQGCNGDNRRAVNPWISPNPFGFPRPSFSVIVHATAIPVPGRAVRMIPNSPS